MTLSRNIPVADVPLLIVGAGPHALTLLSYLHESDPSLAQDVMLVDEQPLMTKWHGHFSRLTIDLLRSGCVHHPHPSPFEMVRFAKEQGRSNEMYGRLGRPSTQLFADFCNDLQLRLGVADRHMKDRVTRVEPLAGGNVLVGLSRGTEVVASRVVICTNPVRPDLPTWFRKAKSRYPDAPGLVHSDDWSTEGAADSRLVIGGGLTAAQIARGTPTGTTSWLTRSDLRKRDLDVAATWLGGDLREFHSLKSLRHRVNRTIQARGGGSLPPFELRQMRMLIGDAAIAHTLGTVHSLQPETSGHGWNVQISTNGTTQTNHFAEVIAATGSNCRLKNEPLWRHCRQHFPTPRTGGVPYLATDLSWPGTRVHVMGGLAQSQVGPTSRTLIGARIAAERIVGRINPAKRRYQYPQPHGQA